MEQSNGSASHEQRPEPAPPNNNEGGAAAAARPKDDSSNDEGPPISPPYWYVASAARARGDSNLSDVPSSSQPSVSGSTNANANAATTTIFGTSSSSRRNRLSGPIRLRDNSEEGEYSEQARACWARSVRIEDYVIVSGSVSKAGMGSYVVWNCTVETLNVSGSLFFFGVYFCFETHRFAWRHQKRSQFHANLSVFSKADQTTLFTCVCVCKILTCSPASYRVVHSSYANAALSLTG